MKEYEEFAIDCIEINCEEPSITKAHLDNEVNDKMEKSSLKCKGHIKQEDLKSFCLPKKSSKSDNGLRSNIHTTKDEINYPKAASLHSYSDNVKIYVSQCKLTENRRNIRSQDEVKCSVSNKRASKLTVEISAMLKKLSEMHSHDNNQQSNIKDFLPADDSVDLIKEIEVIDQDLYITMKDISPCECEIN